MSEWNRKLTWAQLKEKLVDFLGEYERDFLIFSSGFGFGLLAAWLL